MAGRHDLIRVHGPHGDDGPGTGPHPVSQEQLRAAFHPGAGWTVTALEPDRVQTRYHDEDGAPAWFATIKRV